MAVITISRGSYSHGKEIAEKVGEMLGYECISREILLAASQFFQVSEKRLLQSIHDAPSILERVTHGRERYIAYIRAALLDHVKKNNVVYHGHAGHLLIPEIPCVLKVRAIADMDERIAFLQQERKITRDEAMAHITQQDRQRALWTRYLYRVDIDDPRLYDVIIHTGNLTIGDACEIICCAARSETYQVTSESERAINDIAVVSHIKAALQTIGDADVVSNDGLVRVNLSAQKIKRTGMISPRLQMHVQEQIREDLTKEILKIAQAVPGVKEVVCNVELPYYA